MLHLFLSLALLSHPAEPTPTPVALSATPEIALPWHDGISPSVENLGDRVGIVFSPDLAPKQNRRFYESLGFAYFETARWTEVLQQLRTAQSSEETKIDFLVIESHGANGNGLKLQAGRNPSDLRSYISIGALQEAAEKLGIRTVILSACNAGRLFRPEIYMSLERDPGDELFLPPTAGILDAGRRFDPAKSSAVVVRRKQSNVETLMEGRFDELPSWLRGQLEKEGWSQGRFAISTMLIQLMLGDRKLELVSTGFETEKSRADLTRKESERLFQRFSRFLDHAGRPPTQLSLRSVD